MPLFHYQKTIHERKLSPGPYSNYRTYKKYLREEFDAACVYCRMPDSLSEMKSYAVEHYKPKSKFPELETEYSNLFYSCCSCNSYKGSFWPEETHKKLEQFIPNPCDHVMHSHLRLRPEGMIQHHSFAGEWTIDLLDLNDPGQIQKRKAFLLLKKNTDSEISTLKRLHAKLKKIEKDIDHKKLKSLQDDIAKIENELTELEDALKVFGV